MSVPNAFPMPQPEFQGLDQYGNPLAGGLLYSYQAGTTTPLATYTDSTAGTPNANPVVLDSAGRASVWISNSSAYKFVLKSAAGATIWTQDNVPSNFSVTSFNGAGIPVSATLVGTNSSSQFIEQTGSITNNTG